MDTLAEQARSGDPRSIERVAANFESLFVSMVLKEMRQTLEPDTLFGSDTSDAYGGLFDMYLSQHVVQAGGFGVAKMVRQYLERRKPEGADPNGASSLTSPNDRLTPSKSE
jgi:Rod binding domain-containing protein